MQSLTGAAVSHFHLVSKFLYRIFWHTCNGGADGATETLYGRNERLARASQRPRRSVLKSQAAIALTFVHTECRAARGDERHRAS